MIKTCLRACKEVQASIWAEKDLGCGSMHLNGVTPPFIFVTLILEYHGNRRGVKQV